MSLNSQLQLYWLQHTTKGEMFTWCSPHLHWPEYWVHMILLDDIQRLCVCSLSHSSITALLHTLPLLSGLLHGGLSYLGHPARSSAPGKTSIWLQWLKCIFSFWSNSLFLMCHFDHRKHFQMLRLMCGTSSFSSVVRCSLRDVIKNKAEETI